MTNQTPFETFQKIDIRLGKIIDVMDFPEAKNPSYKLKIDFGSEIGIKKSCAQLPKKYTQEELLNKQVICVVNFSPRQIGPTVSEVLTLGLPDAGGNAILLSPDDKGAIIGGRLF